MATTTPCKFYGTAKRHAKSVSRTNPRRYPSRSQVPLHRARIRRFGNLLRRRFSLYHLLLLPALALLAADFPGRIAKSPVVSTLVRQSPPIDPFNVLPGVSIVAVCMNRHQTLRKVLARWRTVNKTNEIIILDWSSNPPLRDIVMEHPDPRIKFIRVNNEPEWVLSRAYNLAIRASSRSTVVRTDCDYLLAEDFVDVHPLPKSGPSRFYAGNYRLARNANEVHLNGAVVIRRADFFKVGGYDERIQTYGWDDEDLYTRLEKVGVKKSDISYKHITHVPHDDNARAQHDVRFVQVEIDLNRILLENLKDDWSPVHMNKSRWSVVSNAPGVTTVIAGTKPQSLKGLNPTAKIDAAWKLALEQRLANDYQVPWDVLINLETQAKKMLLKRLNLRAASQKEGVTPRILFVHCMHGLGNRLRALGSAMSFAKNTGRELVVIWETDAHISAKFEDLFDTDLVVLPKMKVGWPFKNLARWDKLWNNFTFYNYMEMEGSGAIKDKFVEDHKDKHMYIKTAYVMKADTKLTSWDQDNENLRSLRPVATVRERLDQLKKQGLADMVGVHIRDRTLDRDIKNVNFQSEYGDKASEEMDYWRRKSSHLNFIAYMKELVKEDTNTKFYVATDTVEVLSRLQKEFPGRIVTTTRDCDGRDGFCIRFAMTDLLALAGTKKILGSNWSSFTEAAERFGAKKALLAGKDFALDTKKPKTR